MLKKSWAGEFRRNVLAVLPVEELSGEVVDKYMKEGGKEVANDLYDLVMESREEKDVILMSSYKLMVRVLNEQCIVKEPVKGEWKGRIEVKKNNQVSSDALQNPSKTSTVFSGSDPTKERIPCRKKPETTLSRVKYG